MAKIAYSQVVELLLGRFPEFRETDDFKYGIFLDIPYSVWGAFGRYITNYMNRLPADRIDDDPMVVRMFDFANELMDTGDDETRNIVVIELFENFCGYRKTLQLARRKLKPEHVAWLEKAGSWIGTTDLHYEGELIEPHSLAALHWLLVDCSWRVHVRGHVHPVGTEPVEPLNLESSDHRLDLEMQPGIGPHYTFFGDGDRETVVRELLGDFSKCLADGDIAHQVRLYRATGGADILLQEFRHRWPPEDDDLDSS